MAIDDCRDALPFRLSKTYSIAGLKKIVRDVVKTTYEQHVLNHAPKDRENYDFKLLVAICTKGEPVKLFCTEGTSIAPVYEYACRGIGQHLAEYIVSSGYEPGMTVDEVAVLATRTLAATKRHVDSIGGQSQFMAIRNGVLSPVILYDVGAAEDSIANYERMMSRLLVAIGNGTGKEFRNQLQSSIDQAQLMRRSWMEAGSPWRGLMASLTQTTPQP